MYFWLSLGLVGVTSLLLVILPDNNNSILNIIKTEVSHLSYLANSEPDMNSVDANNKLNQLNNSGNYKDWLQDNYKCLILMYPELTECGIGVFKANNKIYSTFVCRKSEISQWNRRYIEGIVYNYKYYPVGDDFVGSFISYNGFDNESENKMFTTINFRRSLDGYNILDKSDVLTEIARKHSYSMYINNLEFIYKKDSSYYCVIDVE